jgi:hypothetical protein
MYVAKAWHCMSFWTDLSAAAVCAARALRLSMGIKAAAFGEAMGSNRALGISRSDP